MEKDPFPFSSLLNPCGKCRRRSREGCCTALGARSRWIPSAGDSSPGGKGIESFPGSGPRSACTPENPFGSRPLPRFRKFLRRRGSDIHRWASFLPPPIFEPSGFRSLGNSPESRGPRVDGGQSSRTSGRCILLPDRPRASCRPFFLRPRRVPGRVLLQLRVLLPRAAPFHLLWAF